MPTVELLWQSDVAGLQSILQNATHLFVLTLDHVLKYDKQEGSLSKSS